MASPPSAPVGLADAPGADPTGPDADDPCRTDDGPAFDPAADAQRRLDEMLDVLRRERAAAPAHAATPAPAATAVPAPPAPDPAPQPPAPSAPASERKDPAPPLRSLLGEMFDLDLSDADRADAERDDAERDDAERADAERADADEAETERADAAQAVPEALPADRGAFPDWGGDAEPPDDAGEAPEEPVAGGGGGGGGGEVGEPACEPTAAEAAPVGEAPVEARCDTARVPDAPGVRDAAPPPADDRPIRNSSVEAPPETTPDEAPPHPDEAPRSEIHDEAAFAPPGPLAEPEPPPEPIAAAEPESDPGAEPGGDSVDDYMQALLARMRQARGEEPSPAARKPAPAKPQAPPANAVSPTPAVNPAASGEPAATAPPAARPDAAGESTSEPPAPLPPPAAMPRPRVDKEKLREEMRQLRAIANTSARSAVMESTWKRTRTRLAMEVLLCGVCLGLGLTLLLTSVWGTTVHYTLGGAICLASVWIARNFGRTLDLLHRQKSAAKKAAREEAARTGADPRTPRSGRRALNVPAADDGSRG